MIHLRLQDLDHQFLEEVYGLGERMKQLSKAIDAETEGILVKLQTDDSVIPASATETPSAAEEMPAKEVTLAAARTTERTTLRRCILRLIPSSGGP